MNPRKLLVFLIFCNIYCCPSLVSSSKNVNLEFQFFNLRNLTLLGDSYLRNGVAGLTRDLEVPSSSSGSIIYNYPIAFFDPETNVTASFSTRFAFSIDNINPTSFGDGLTFFLSPNNQTLGSPGGFLGLVNSSQLTKNRFIAVEFDTKLDLDFNDPDGNHVGLDIDSLISVKTANPMLRAVNLKSGNLITAWIDYSNERKKVEVFLSYSSFKPDEPLLSVDIDLSDYLKEFMFAGFSASTEGSTELHHIENWSFQTTGFRPVRPIIHPHNVSDSSVPLKPPAIPVSDSGNRHHKTIGLALGIGCPAFFCAVLVVFGWVSVKKWRGIRTEKSLKAELVTGPREFNYKELKSATKGFHQSRILGHGAFGTVYKAFFMDSGSISAVKRSKHSHEGKSEFLSELSIIACLRHKNLVQLQGWCVEKGELLLVYEFMPNGSLDKVLYQDSDRSEALKWSPIEREEESQKTVNLVDWVWKLYSEGKIVAAADERMNGEFDEAGMKKLLLVGLSCANPDSSERPSMRRVLQILNNEAEPVVVPKVKPSLTFSNSLPLSINEIFSDGEDCGSPKSQLEIRVD
ncbi:putative L-type lectin-domain containing receptor kinase S.7 [Sesamum alatum]|uniref:non-specific serine/threonine protein kinase n=1 Tax=Sesamum alatum TaxID=300844 RepID=A0AAE1XZB6_9LAMI|nr:putative L-type lectin-domain containing receptor kinase S.7 [Sesamum alatum]